MANGLASVAALAAGRAVKAQLNVSVSPSTSFEPLPSSVTVVATKTV